MTVFVSAEPFVGTTLSSSQNQAGVTSYFFPSELGAETAFAVNETGRYVRGATEHIFGRVKCGHILLGRKHQNRQEDDFCHIVDDTTPKSLPCV